MPRIRSVHPQLCEDETLVEVSARAERTFVRLWTELDDEGRGRDNPKLLKARLYPLHDDVTAKVVDDDLSELAQRGLIRRYEVDGERYLSTKPEAWSRWQSPRHPSPSKFPKPPEVNSRPTAERRNGSADGGKPPAGVEGSGEGVGEHAPPQAGGNHKAVFGALEDVFGEAQTRTTKSFYGKTARELVEAGATPEQVRERGAVLMAKRWPDSGPGALAKHWHKLDPNANGQRRKAGGIPVEAEA